MSMKKKIVYLTILGVCSVGLIRGFAYAIPGIDKPWDPSTYWLPTTIDAADTANPAYSITFHIVSKI